MESKLKNITVHYELFGEGKPLIFLPAWGWSANLLAHLMEPIFYHREGWQRVYVAPPGHGRTPGKDWITNQDVMLEVIIQFIDKEFPEERLILAGMSSGAYLARGLLYHRTNLIDGLLLLVPVVWAEESKRTSPPHIVVFEDPTLEPAELEMLSVLNVRSRKLLDKLLAIPRPAADEAGDSDFLERIRRTENYAFSFDVDALPQPFTKPTLIITGRQDSIAGYRDSWQLLEQYPRATYVVLDRAGHYLEDKEEVNKMLVDEWLDRVEESIS
jgi:pimeloyl-ACP methyl ester carboxylesterase